MWTSAKIEKREARDEYESQYQGAKKLLRVIEKNLEKRFIIRNSQFHVRAQNAYETSVALIFVDALQLFHAFLVLLRAGHIEVAAIINRSLFERLVDVLYISKSRKRRPFRYYRFWNVSRYRFFDALKTTVDFPPASDIKRMQQLQEVRERVAKYLKYFQGRHWSGKSIEVRCKEVGLTRHYKISVPEYSSFAHSDPVSAIERVRSYGEYGFSCNYRGEEPSESHIFRLAIPDAFKFQLLLYVALANVFQLAIPNNLMSAVNQLRRQEDFSDCFRKNKILWRSATSGK